MNLTKLGQTHNNQHFGGKSELEVIWNATNRKFFPVKNSLPRKNMLKVKIIAKLCP